jgi:hypothetical protein
MSNEIDVDGLPFQPWLKETLLALVRDLFTFSREVIKRFIIV